MADVKEAIEVSAPSKVACHHEYSKMNSTFRQILEDTMAVCRFLNDSDDGHRLGVHLFSEFVISIGCRLFRFHPLGETNLRDFTVGAYHIGIATFLSTLYIQYGGRRYLKYGVVGKCLQETIKNCNAIISPATTLWLLLLGGPSVLAEADRTWLLEVLRDVTETLEVESWSEARAILTGFPWFTGLHDKPAEALFQGR